MTREESIIMYIISKNVTIQQAINTVLTMNSRGMRTRKELEHVGYSAIINALRNSGHRFPTQTAAYLWQFATLPEETDYLTDEELFDRVDGLGY